MDYVGTIDGEPSPAARGATSSSSSARAPRARLRGAARGRKAGDERTVTVNFPDDYGRGRAGGQGAQFAVTVKEIKRKDLPALDDDFASDAAGFDTLAELREDIAAKLREATSRAWRPSSARPCLDAVVRDSKVDVRPTLVDARAQELWERMLHSLSHQGIDQGRLPAIAGRDEADILEEAKPDAEQALRREAVIAAVIEAEDIEPSEATILAALRGRRARGIDARRSCCERLSAGGRSTLEDLAQRGRSTCGRARHSRSRRAGQARDKLWTPGRRRARRPAALDAGRARISRGRRDTDGRAARPGVGRVLGVRRRQEPDRRAKRSEDQ
jgi:trigger factor